MRLDPQEGIWWFPPNPSKRFPGELSFDSSEGGELKLTIVGDHRERQELQEHKLIYGKIDGRDVTLVDCFDTETSSSADMVRTHTLVNLVYLGFLLPDASAPNLLSATAQFQSLNRWFHISGFETKYHENHTNVSVTYRAPAPISVSVPDAEIIFRIMPTNFSFLPSWDGELTIHEKVYVHIKPLRPKTFDEIYEVVRALSDFFSIATDSLCLIENLTVEGAFNPEKLTNGDIVYPHADVFFWNDYDGGKRRPHPMDMLFRYEHVNERLAGMLSNWIGKSAQLRSARTLYISSLYRPRAFVESKFLSLVQAVEAFHRQFMNDKHMEQETYKKTVLPQLLEAIPEHLPADFRNSAIGRLATLNEYSLAMRLRAVVARHRQVIDLFDPNTDNTIQGIVKLRNQLTHEARMSVDLTKAAHYCDVLRLILELSFIGEMTSDLAFVHDCFKKSWHYHRLFGTGKKPTPPN